MLLCWASILSIFFSCCLSNLSSRTDLGLELGPSGILDHSPVARVEKT
jgi:hypothetical protein